MKRTPDKNKPEEFLMHRVELKAKEEWERAKEIAVPNAPCGVESWTGGSQGDLRHPFLMHRVELKGQEFLTGTATMAPVPNAPCGVESLKEGEISYETLDGS